MTERKHKFKDGVDVEGLQEAIRTDHLLKQIARENDQKNGFFDDILDTEANMMRILRIKSDHPQLSKPEFQRMGLVWPDDVSNSNRKKRSFWIRWYMSKLKGHKDYEEVRIKAWQEMITTGMFSKKSLLELSPSKTNQTPVYQPRT